MRNKNQIIFFNDQNQNSLILRELEIYLTKFGNTCNACDVLISVFNMQVISLLKNASNQGIITF